MEKELIHIRNRIAEIKAELSEIGPMRPGSVCKQYREPAHKRGEYYQLSYSYNGKSHTKHVRSDEVSETMSHIAEYKRFKALVAEWTALGLRECELLTRKKRSHKKED